MPDTTNLPAHHPLAILRAHHAHAIAGGAEIVEEIPPPAALPSRARRWRLVHPTGWEDTQVATSAAIARNKSWQKSTGGAGFQGYRPSAIKATAIPA